jgi:tetratricopeptide (TPR) repeat protein
MSADVPSEEEIANYQELLAIHRRTLAQLCKQTAQHGGESYAPPNITNGIHEARENIRHIKTTLRAGGVPVENHLDDEPPPQQIASNQGRATGAQPDAAPTSPVSQTNVTTEDDYAEGSIDKRQGAFIGDGAAVHGPVVGNISGGQVIFQEAAREHIEQHLTISDPRWSGNITQVGKIIQIIKHPAAWQQAIWDFLVKNRGFLVALVVLEAALAVVYLQYRDLYLIPLLSWGIAACLLIAASWGWYSWIWLGHTQRKLILTLLITSSLISVVGLQTWQIVLPERFDQQAFGIAVAELGEGPGFQRTVRAREISGQVYEYLCESMAKQAGSRTLADPCGGPAGQSQSRHVQIRKVGVIGDSQTAQAYGKRIGAAVVIWGQVLTSAQGRVTIHFQVLETQDRAVNPEFPIFLPVATTSPEIFARELNLDSDPVQLKVVIAQQSTLISTFILGLVAYVDLDFPEAVTRFEAATQIIKDDSLLEVSPEGKSLLYFYLGSAYSNIGRLQDGQEWLMRAREANAQEPAVLLGLALNYRSLGQDKERDTSLRLALDVINTWLTTHPDDSTTTAALYDRGMIYQLQRQYTDALQDFEALIERDPDNYIAYTNLGQVAAQLGRFDQAEDSFRRAIGRAETKGTNSAWAHLNLALAYEMFHKPELARSEYLAAIQLSHGLDWMYYFYARFLGSQQEIDAAVRAYQDLIRATDNKGWAYGVTAQFFRSHGRLEDAVENYQRAVHAQPDDALVWTYLAETYFELHDTDNALQAYEEAVKSGTNIYYVYASFAGALYRLGDFGRAAQMYEKSLELRPLDPETLLNLGQTYEVLGQKEKAKELYLRILNSSEQLPEQVIRVARDRLRALGVESP